MREPVFLEEVPSTNDYLWAVKKVEPFFSVAAFRQTGGKGAKGRAFASPEGGLYMSAYLEPTKEILPVLTPLAAVAVRRAVKDLFFIDLGVKWVNDLYLSGKKVCGILTETRTDTVCRTVIGVGVNVYRSVSGYDGFENVAGWLFDAPASREIIKRLARSVLFHLSEVLSDPDSAMQEYAKHMILTGKTVLYGKGDRTTECVVDGVDEKGRLLLSMDGKTVAVEDGEVTWKK